MWNEEQRQIVTITVGGRAHKLDPLPVLRRYRAAVRKIGETAFAAALESVLKSEDTPEGAAILFPLLYDVMGWPSLQADPEKGYTEGEVIEGVSQFLAWVVESKKKAENSPFSAPSAGDSDATPVTGNIADSSSAEASSNPEGLGLPTSAPA